VKRGNDGKTKKVTEHHSPKALAAEGNPKRDPLPEKKRTLADKKKCANMGRN